MKKVYSYIDCQDGHIIASSKTRATLEEMMCDDFMEVFRWEMQEAADAHWIDVQNPTKDCRQYARDTWNTIMRWYKESYDIQKSRMV